MCGIAGQCVSVPPIECVSEVVMHSSVVCCSLVFLMLRQSGMPCSQSPLELVAPDLKGKVVIGDDKDHSKIWVADQVDLSRYVAECVELDQGRDRRDDLRPRDVSVWLKANASA